MEGGLSGSDGSSEGRQIAIQGIKTKYRQPGFYGEVSHKVEAIALSAGALVVCATHVPVVLKKKVVPSEDGIHYNRNISNVGAVTKVLIGLPKGIPTTTSKNPSCPVPGHLAMDFVEEVSDEWDVLEHYACQID